MIAVVALVALVLGVPYAAYLSVTQAGNFATTTNLLRTLSAEAFFVLVVLGSFSPYGLYYRPAELALLFPAPIARRHLVLYNILWRARISLLSAVWLATLAAHGGRPPWQSLLGYTLALLLPQTSSQWFAIQRCRLRAHTWACKWAAVAACAAIATAWWHGAHLTLLSALAWSTRPALEVLSATSPSAVVGWAALAAATIAVLMLDACREDAAYHEAALAGSRARRARRGRMSSLRRGTPTALPRFPRLGGAGPVAWRQCLELVRNPRKVALVVLTVVFAALGAVVVVGLEAGDDVSAVPHTMRAWIVILVLCITPLLSGDSMGFDFRRDIDRMTTLKTLPISPQALAAGQFPPATLFVSVVQILGICVVAALSEAVPWIAVAALAVVLPPMNWCAIAAENTLFLLAPYRTVVDDRGDMTFAGRLALAAVLKLGSLLVLTGCSVAIAVRVLQLTGSLAAMVAIPAALLALACRPVTRLAGWSFCRFDVARDVPA